MADDKCAESIEVRSAPLLNLADLPVGSLAGSLDLLSEEELAKITRNNTKKNDGGRKGRFRSQMERVCRRFDNMAVEAKLQQRQCLEALPIVQPERAAAVDALVANDRPSTSSRSSGAQSEEAARSFITAVESLEMTPQGEDCFDIEPATNDSIFSSKSSGLPKSVRISTSVCFLEYNSSGADNEPISVSTYNRFQHPTRRDREKMMKRAMAEDSEFPKARLRRGSMNAEADEWDKGGKDTANDRKVGTTKRNSLQLKTSSSPRASPEPATPTAMKRARVASTSGRETTPAHCGAMSPGPPRATSQAPASAANTAFAIPSPNGPYGPRRLAK